MPSSVVHVALALAIAVGLLGRFYDRRAVFVIVLIALFPELDTAFGWAMSGAHRTVLHTMAGTAILAAVLFWETSREGSWIRDRWGARGVRIAWVGLFVHTFAHLALDWAHLSGVNFFWPFVDQFYNLDSELYLSTTDGIVQTFVEITEDPETGRGIVDAGQGGTRAENHVSNPAQPSPDPEPGPIDRRFPIAVGGWQLYLVVVGAFTLVAKRLQTPHSKRETEKR